MAKRERLTTLRSFALSAENNSENNRAEDIDDMGRISQLYEGMRAH
jgi:hypothetical protein